MIYKTMVDKMAWTWVTCFRMKCQEISGAIRNEIHVCVQYLTFWWWWSFVLWHMQVSTINGCRNTLPPSTSQQSKCILQHYIASIQDTIWSKQIQFRILYDFHRALSIHCTYNQLNALSLSTIYSFTISPTYVSVYI
jgi:hypothetical protein